MSYTTILVCLTNLDNAARLTRTACTIARKFGAHLVGLHTLQAMDIYPGMAIDIPADITASFNQSQKEEAEKIRHAFQDETVHEEFVSEWRCFKARASNAGKSITEHARCADLIIMAQPDDEHDRIDQTNIQRQVIEESGRPVLIIPKSGSFEKIGTNMLVGWSATKEAARAVHDAIPFAQNGGSANIFWVSKSESKDSYLAHTGHEMAACLDRQGVKTNVSHRLQVDLSVGDELLNEAADTGADMIVAGAYGHSRVYDFMIGATTPHLMKHMTVPVLFSC